MSALADEDLRSLQQAVGIDRNDAAKTDRKAGEAAAHVQVAPTGNG